MKKLQSKLIRKLTKSFCILLTFIFAFSVFATSGITVEAASIKKPKISSVTAKSSTSIKIKWKKVSGVTGYIIYQQKGSGEYKNIKVITDNDVTSYTKKGLSSATKYSYKVRAYKSKSGKKTYSSKSTAKSTYTKPSTPEITSIKSPSKTTIKLKWEKISKASGYAIYRKNGSDYNRVATIKSNKTTSYTIKGLKSGKKYTYVVRSYIKKNGKNIYSSQSISESIYTSHTHKYSKAIVKPTCTKKGYTLNKCFCGKSYKSNYTSPAHKYSKTIVKPTCTEKGYTLNKCFCGKSYKTNYTSPVHNYKDYICTNCKTVDKSHAYEYLKNWVIENGEVNGAHIIFIPEINDKTYGFMYSANEDELLLCEGYYNTYNDFVSTFIFLDDYKYDASIGSGSNDYIEGKLNAKSFTSNSPITYEDYNSTYYNMGDFHNDTRISICDSLYWLIDFLNENIPDVTIADLGFESFE